MKLNILFENDNFIAINKDINISVHKGTNSIINVIDIFKQTVKYKKTFLKLAHRLDKSTSGCLIIAKNKNFLKSFQLLLFKRDINKEYHTIVAGKTKKEFSIQTKQTLLNKYNNKIKNNDTITLSVCNTIKHYNDKYSLIKIKLITGKLHQIRIHLTHIGHPIVCDQKYGNCTINKQFIDRKINSMFLHAKSINFFCYVSKKQFDIHAKYNCSVKKLIKYIKTNR